MTANDISRIPPTDVNGEMSRAAQLLRRFRRQLCEEKPMSLDWQRWVAESLLHGLPSEDGVI
ncbi:MAG: hypothetical protein ACYCQK_01595 [Acidiferrobacteraceae bacterium]